MARSAGRRIPGVSTIAWIGCLLLLAAALPTGCSEGDSGEAGGDLTGETVAPPAKGPSPKELATQLGGVLGAAKTREDCKPIEQVNRRSPFKFGCPPTRQSRAAMRKLEVLGAAVYGGGAVVDYRTGGGEDAAMVLLLDEDSRWVVSRFGLLAKPSAQTSDEDSRAAFDRTIDTYLRAVRTRDCALFIEHAATLTSKRAIVCGDEFEQTKPLADILKRNRGAEPEYYGGNSSFGFYRLPLPRSGNKSMTFSVFKQPTGSGYVVLNGIPGPDVGVRG